MNILRAACSQFPSPSPQLAYLDSSQPVSPRRAPLFIDTSAALKDLLQQLIGVNRVALDIESNGMFAYHPCVCTVQLSWLEANEQTHVAIVDTLAIPVGELADLLRRPTVIKVIHDLAFDARILHLEHIDLRAVRDTSVAAAYLGKPGTGLATLLKNELNVHVEKKLQNSDWARRPLSQESLYYLAGDVQDLLALDTLLANEVEEMGISNEVATETAYRLIDALETQVEVRPPHQRIRGHERLNPLSQRVLEAIAATRESIAKEKNLPPQRIVGDKLMLVIADRKPQRLQDIQRFRALKRLNNAQQNTMVQAIVQAVKKGPASTPPPAPPHPLTRREILARKGLEKRLQEWRKHEAKRRKVNEQVVLPTHCIRRLVGGAFATPETIAAMPGFGRARTELYANVLADVIQQQLAQP